MSNKDVDFALVGHNYLTFLLSAILLQKGKKVLVLDDDRFNYGEFFTNSLTYLDIQLLKTWGEKNKVQPLIEIEKYLTPTSFLFHVGKKQLLLGDSAFRNYRELCRKFPHIFLNENSGSLTFEKECENFNNKYTDFCQKMSQLVFSENKASKLLKLFEANIPEEFTFHFNHFFKLFDSEPNLSELQLAEFKALVYMSRGFFQRRLSPTGSRSELIHLFFSLISPYFKLNHEQLLADLLSLHKDQGGTFIKFNLSDLRFHKGVVKSFELESVDGLIRPKRMGFIGGYPVGLPIKLKTSSSSYNCLNIKLKFDSAVPSSLQGRKIVFCSPLKIGTERPFWEANFSVQEAVFSVVILKREATKIEFIKERVLTSLIDDLKYIYPEFLFNYKDFEMQYTLDVFIEDKDYNAFKRIDRTLGRKIVDVFVESTPVLFSRLKNVIYFGPYNEDSLGTFSSLIELKYLGDKL